MMEFRQGINVVLRWVLALIFTLAAGLKLGGVAEGRLGGAGEATMFGALPAAAQWGLVGVELALAVWLVGGWRVRGAAVSAIVLLSTFMGVIVWELGKPRPQPCGCLGTITGGSLWYSVALDGGMLALAVWLYFSAGGDSAVGESAVVGVAQGEASGRKS